MKKHEKKKKKKVAIVIYPFPRTAETHTHTKITGHMKQIICIQLYRTSQNLKVTELAIYANEVITLRSKGRLTTAPLLSKKQGSSCSIAAYCGGRGISSGVLNLTAP